MAIAGAALLLTACGGGGDSTDSELEAALEDLVTGDLATLVLPLDEIGAIGRDMVIDPDSGPRDNARAAESSIDPDDTASDHERAGRLGGFVANYANNAASEPEDVYTITPSVHLYRDADAASAALEDQLADIDEAEGDDRDGVVMEEVERFDASVGDESQGITFVAEAGALGTLRGTAVYGRVGRLGFTVGIVAVGDDSREDDVRELAEQQFDWITGVLKGEIDAEPLEVPTPTEAPSLGELALQLSDLPPGFDETEAGFETNDPAGEFDYTRSFEASGESAEIGSGTRVISLDNNIIVFGDAVEARAFIAAVSAILEGDTGAEFLANLLADEGLAVENLQVEQRNVDLGDETRVVEASAQTNFGDVVLAFIMSRQGRVVSVFIVTGEAEGWNLADVGPLAELVFARLEAAGLE